MKSPSSSELDRQVGPDDTYGRRRTGRTGRPRSRRRRWWKSRPFRIARALLLVFLVWLIWSLGGALIAPGGDSVAARVAEWARDNHMGAIVTALESAQYNANPPALGGKPTIALKPPAETTAPKPNAATTTTVAAPVLPPRLVSPAGAALPDEGTWQVLAQVNGAPALVGAYLRPDAAHTSYVAGVVSMDPRILRFELHPGTTDPGSGNWGVAPTIAAGSRAGLLATFNGGFKVNESGGGFFLNGVTRGTLTPGIASLVFYKDGHVAVGVWGRDVTMTADVVGVRQNLHLVVDQSAVPAGVDSNVQSAWGPTIGGKEFVWRSGVGVTADGRIIFVYGPALSVRTLADLLHQAGCVEAMQLDINPAWMSFMYYNPAPDPANPTPTKLLPTQERPADRYFTPTSRDFVAVYAR